MRRSVGDQGYEKSVREKEKNETFSRWNKQRLDTLRAAVSAHDVLRHFGVSLKSGTSTSEEQISCPFHGDDKKPSARVYPEGGSSPSGVYCWTCQKRWDIVSLWKNFHGDETMKFGVALRGLEKAFGIVAPDAPEYDYIEDGVDEAKEEKLDEVYQLLHVCENRLKEGKPCFDMRGFLTIGKLLDSLYHALERELITPEDAEKRARLILDKIGEKIRSA